MSMSLWQKALINPSNYLIAVELMMHLPPRNVGRFDRVVFGIKGAIEEYFATLHDPVVPDATITNFEKDCFLGFWVWSIFPKPYHLCTIDIMTSLGLLRIMKEGPKSDQQPIRCSVPGIWTVSLSAIDELHINGSEGLDVDKGQLVPVPEWREGGLDRVARLVENQVAVQGVEKAFSDISKAGLIVLRRHLKEHREEWDKDNKLDAILDAYLQSQGAH